MEYDPETNEWKVLLSTGIKAFRNACAIYQDKMLIFGGDIAKPEDAFSSISHSTFEYNFTTNTWRKIETTGIYFFPSLFTFTFSSLFPHVIVTKIGHVLALEAPSGVILKEKYFVVFGGFSQLGQCNRSFALNLETNVWKEIPILMGNDSIREHQIQITGNENSSYSFKFPNIEKNNIYYFLSYS